ncbi:MAG: TetR family transcriptional regulator [Alphaproteobacteria bacterium]|nr:TetR family transcriptional regulator [Alphaproteobacteria bacterium]
MTMMTQAYTFSDQTALLQATLDLIKKYGWKDLHLNDIIRHLKISPAELQHFFPTKLCLLKAFFQYIDQQTLAQLEHFEPNELPRNRLFSIIMTRFDVLSNYKPLISELTYQGWKDVALVSQTLPQSLNILTWLLEAADVDTTELLGKIRLKIFAIFYGTTVLAWLKDDTPDMAPTMAYLDKGLAKLSQIPGFF